MRSAVRLAAATAQADALPSWNEGPAKRAIVEFVQATTTPGSPRFVPVEQRIATFDQDGTLWVEHPALADEAKQGGWLVISMKDDWKRIFSFEP